MKPNRPALAFPAVLLLLAQAHAVEPDEAAARLKALMEAQGGAFAWAFVSGDEESATIEGATITPPGGGKPIVLGTIEMTGIKEAGDGSLSVGTLASPGYTYAQRGTSYEVTGLEVGDLVLPPPGAAGDAAVPVEFDTARVESFKVSKGNKELFSAADVFYDIEAPEAEGDAYAVTAEAESFRATGVRESSPVIDDIAAIMGIETFAGSFTARGRWSPTQGDVALEEVHVLLDGSGRLSLTFTGGGYTSELIRSGQAMSLDFSGGGGEQSMQTLMAQGMAMFGLASRITFGGASMRFEPEAGAGPDPRAAKEARDRIARDLAPFGQEFAARSVAEIDEYLADPRSIEVRADPPAPVGATTLMLGLMAAPRQLPEQLGLSITANE